MREPAVLLDEPSLTCATWRSLVIARWHAAPSADTVRSMRLALLPWVDGKDAFAAVNVVDIADIGTLAEDTRAEVVATQRLFERKQRALATVIHGDGFWAATIRSVAAGLGALSRVTFPQRVFHDVDPAVRWIATRLPEVEGSVQRAIDAARAVRRAGRG